MSAWRCWPAGRRVLKRQNCYAGVYERAAQAISEWFDNCLVNKGLIDQGVYQTRQRFAISQVLTSVDC